MDEQIKVTVDRDTLTLSVDHLLAQGIGSEPVRDLVFSFAALCQVGEGDTLEVDWGDLSLLVEYLLAVGARDRGLRGAVLSLLDAAVGAR